MRNKKIEDANKLKEDVKKINETLIDIEIEETILQEQIKEKMIIMLEIL